MKPHYAIRFAAGFNCKEKSNQRVARPVEQPGRKAIVSCESQALDIACGNIISKCNCLRSPILKLNKIHVISGCSTIGHYT